MVFAYNHDIEEREIRDVEMHLTVLGEYGRIEKAVINFQHTNPFSCWSAPVGDLPSWRVKGKVLCFSTQV